MALKKGKFSEIPSDAIVLSESDALKYQTKVLKDWKNKRDIWMFDNGGTILAACSAVAGIYINNHYRLKYRLGSYGRIATYIPVCVLPAIMSFGLHTEFVLPSIILQKNCPICLEMRGSAFQAGMGCIFPVILAPLASASLALTYNTYEVPGILKEPSKVISVWKNHTKPISNILFAIFIGQALLGSLITYFEAKSIETVNNKLTLIGYELEKQNELY